VLLALAVELVDQVLLVLNDPLAVATGLGARWRNLARLL